jgi:hypothetical protein
MTVSLCASGQAESLIIGPKHVDLYLFPVGDFKMQLRMSPRDSLEYSPSLAAKGAAVEGDGCIILAVVGL